MWPNILCLKCFWRYFVFRSLQHHQKISAFYLKQRMGTGIATAETASNTQDFPSAGLPGPSNMFQTGYVNVRKLAIARNWLFCFYAGGNALAYSNLRPGHRLSSQGFLVFLNSSKKLHYLDLGHDDFQVLYSLPFISHSALHVLPTDYVVTTSPRAGLVLREGWYSELSLIRSNLEGGHPD
jgi:hypothetical protein